MPLENSAIEIGGAGVFGTRPKTGPSVAPRKSLSSATAAPHWALLAGMSAGAAPHWPALAGADVLVAAAVVARVVVDGAVAGVVVEAVESGVVAGVIAEAIEGVVEDMDGHKILAVDDRDVGNDESDGVVARSLKTA